MLRDKGLCDWLGRWYACDCTDSPSVSVDGHIRRCNIGLRRSAAPNSKIVNRYSVWIYYVCSAITVQLTFKKPLKAILLNTALNPNVSDILPLDIMSVSKQLSGLWLASDLLWQRNSTWISSEQNYWFNRRLNCDRHLKFKCLLSRKCLLQITTTCYTSYRTVPLIAFQCGYCLTR